MCNREASSVEEAAKTFAGDANFVGVAWTGSDDDFQGFIDEYGLTFPQISDDPGDVYARFEIPAQPAFVIVGSDGSTDTLFGAVEPELLAQVIDEAG